VTLYTVVEAIARPLFMRLYRIELVGAERIPTTGPCVLASNHESVLDGVFLSAATRRQVRFMAKAELYQYPVLRQLMDALGCFPVERGRDEGQAVGRGLRLLQGGEVIGIFPQGTCLPYRERLFRRGAARLAISAGAPLVPVALIGTERSLQPRSHRMGFPKVTIVVGEPIPVERGEPSPESATELTRRLELAVDELRRPFGDPDHVWYPPGLRPPG
jgi:1-acyl-sn-glycerol-3-phosphate acyltransferase